MFGVMLFVSDECCVHVNLAISVILAIERTQSFQLLVIHNGRMEVQVGSRCAKLYDPFQPFTYEVF